MPNFKTSPAGGPSSMKMYGQGKNPIMMKDAKPDFLDLDKDGNTTEPMKGAAPKMYGKKAATKMYDKAAPTKNYNKGYYGA